MFLVLNPYTGLELVEDLSELTESNETKVNELNRTKMGLKPM